MNVKWLIEIVVGSVTYSWSTQACVWNSNTYTANIIGDTFNGISLSRMSGESGLINMSDLQFGVKDCHGTASSFRGAEAVVRLVVDEAQQRVWRWRVKRCEEVYGEATFWLESILTAYLDGDWPLTRRLEDIWPDDTTTGDDAGSSSDGYVAPVVFGTAYIPLRSVNTGTERFYVLGVDTEVYTINEVQTPKEWGNSSVWGSGFSQSTSGGYKLMQAIIADSDNDGNADANGLWLTGKKFLDMPTNFSSTEVASSSDVSPAVVIRYFLEKNGIPPDHISTATFDAAADQYATWGVCWNGGWYTLESRESALSSMLLQCGSTLVLGDQIELHPLSTTSKATFTSASIKKESFSYSPVWPSESDGGYVEFIADGNAPQDQPTRVVCRSNSGQADEGAVESPSSTTINCRFIRDGQIARKCGMIFFNRTLDKCGSLSFSALPSTTVLALNPDDVITINNSLYGETRDVLISQIDFKKDGSTKISCVEFEHGLLGFSTTATAVTVTPDTSTGWMIPTMASVPLLGAKKNTVSFDTPSNGYVYIHGFDGNGDAADINGTISGDGGVIPIPRVEAGATWTVAASQEGEGYIIFDIIKSGKFTVETKAHSLAFAKKASGQWTYDSGGGWVDFTPAHTDTIIGSLSNGPTAINTVNVWPNGMSLGIIIDEDVSSEGMGSLDIQGWQFAGTFSATDSNAVAWSAGALTFSGDDVFSISAGNTGNMTAKTYIYFSLAASETTLQTTTNAVESVGLNKVLLCIAEDETEEAWFVSFGGDGTMSIRGGDIIANSITGNEILANSITVSEINTGTVNIGAWSGDIDDVFGAGNLASLDSADYGTQVSGIKPPDNADRTSTHTAYDTSRVNGTSASTVKNNAANGATFTSSHAGNLATKDLVGKALLDSTVIAGGYLRTSLIQTSAINIGSWAGNADDIDQGSSNFFAAEAGAVRKFSSLVDDGGTLTIASSKLVVNTPEGIKVNSGAGIAIKGSDTDPGELRLEGTEYATSFGCSANGGFACIWPDRATNPGWLAVGITPDAVTQPFTGIVFKSKYFFKVTAPLDVSFITPNFYVHGTIHPDGDGIRDIGTSFTAWKSIYYCTLYDSCASHVADSAEYDCLAILKNLKPDVAKDGTMRKTTDDLPKLDKKTLPDYLTNKELLYEEMRAENGDLINYEDFIFLWDDNQLDFRIARNADHYVDMVVGAVLALDKKNKKKDDRISQLEKRIKAIETSMSIRPV